MSIRLMLEKRGLSPLQISKTLDEYRVWQGKFVQRDVEAAQVEDRSIDGEMVETESTDELILYGYSAVFDSDSEVLYGMFREQIKRGAFKNVLKNSPDVRLLENHEGRPHARTINGTLELKETPRGLYRKAVLNSERQDSKDLYEAVRRGDYSQSSFAFKVARDEWRMCNCAEEQGEDYYGCSCIWERDILEVSELLDDSVVTYPAYPDSTAVVTNSEEPVDSVASMGEASGDRSAAATDEERRDEPALDDTSVISPKESSDQSLAIRLWLEAHSI
jgi:HK97 family phage prohead protease